jgi:hypothetical protein
MSRSLSERRRSRMHRVRCTTFAAAIGLQRAHEILGGLTVQLRVRDRPGQRFCSRGCRGVRGRCNRCWHRAPHQPVACAWEDRRCDETDERQHRQHAETRNRKLAHRDNPRTSSFERKNGRDVKV